MDVPHLKAVPNVTAEPIEIPEIIREMELIIDDADAYAHEKGMGLDWGFETLNEAFNGLNTGLQLIGGSANTGN